MIYNRFIFLQILRRTHVNFLSLKHAHTTRTVACQPDLLTALKDRRKQQLRYCMLLPISLPLTRLPSTLPPGRQSPPPPPFSVMPYITLQ
jgi:hypothetical protein